MDNFTIALIALVYVVIFFEFEIEYRGKELPHFRIEYHGLFWVYQNRYKIYKGETDIESIKWYKKETLEDDIIG